jgi:acetoacetyl-CoA synthetase
VLDSLVIDVDIPGKPSYMPLFVVLREGVTLDDELVKKIKASVRSKLSPRHVPDDVFTAPDVPRTLSGKKLEIPVKRILMGTPIEKAANLDSMKNPEVLDYYLSMKDRLVQSGSG